MNKEAHFGQIEDYLAGKLNPQKKNEFEQEMSSNSALRDEVALHKELAIHLQDSAENALFDNLVKLRSSAGSNNKKQRWLLLSFLLLIVVGGSLFYFNNSKQTEDTPAVKDAPATKQDSPSTDHQDINTVPIETPSTIPVVPNTESEKSVPKKDSDLKDEHETPPVLAGNFVPNPALESYIGNNVRGGDYQFDITEARFLPGDNYHFFKFSGTVRTDKSDIGEQFQVLLFSNAVEAFEEFKPIVSVPLSYTADKDGFIFDLSSSVDVSPGLYYYLLEDTNSGQVFVVGKVLLK